MFLKLSIQTLWTTWAEPQILGLKLIIDLLLWPFRPPRQIVCRQSYMNPEEKTISWMHVGQAAFKEPVGTRVRYRQDMNSCVHRYTVGLFSHCHIWQSPVSWCCHVWQLINISCGGSKLGLVERSNQSKCLGGGRDWVEWVSLFWHVLYTFKGVKLYMQYLHCDPGGCPWTQGTLHIVHRPSRDHTTQQCWEPSSSHTEVRTKSAPSFNLFSFCPLSSGCFSMTWYSQNNNKTDSMWREGGEKGNKTVKLIRRFLSTLDRAQLGECHISAGDDEGVTDRRKWCSTRHPAILKTWTNPF